MTPDSAARDLRLAERHPELRRECPCDCHTNKARPGEHTRLRRDSLGLWVVPLEMEWCPCDECNGLNWLPLPEAERLGALVRVANCQVIISPPDADGDCVVTLIRPYDNAEEAMGEGPSPEAALAAAIEAAEKE